MSVLFKLNNTWRKASALMYHVSFPVGSIVAYAGDEAPSGCMLCHGQVLNSSDYAELYNVIGTNFGTGDGSTGSFNLPDMRESVPVGAGQNQTNTIASHDVYTVGQFKDDQMQSHTHTCQGGDLSREYGYNAQNYYNQNATQTTTSMSGRTGTTTRGKRTGIEYIIKVVK